jgi:hypothetical protein
MRGHAENDRGGPRLKCRNCGGEFSAERAELGYDYCTSPACVETCLEPLNVVAVAVNKAADQYVLREHLRLPKHVAKSSIDAGSSSLGLRFRKPPAPRQPRTTSDAIAALESELDAQLAVEDDPARRRKLMNDHNAKLRRLDIRYRRIAQRRP